MLKDKPMDKQLFWMEVHQIWVVHLITIIRTKMKLKNKGILVEMGFKISH